jgi:integrase
LLVTLLLAFKVPAGQDGHERLIRTLRLRHGAYGAPEPAAGVGHVTLHALRHTLASILISQGRDVEFVSRQPGHAHTSTTLDTYSHLFDARRHAKKARRGLEADFRAILGTTKGIIA